MKHCFCVRECAVNSLIAAFDQSHTGAKRHRQSSILCEKKGNKNSAVSEINSVKL